jgi:hypothetical protein
MNRRDKALQIAERIADLRREIAQLQAEFYDLVPDDGAPGKSRDLNSLPSRILEVLDSKPDHSFEAPEIAVALGMAGKVPHIRSALFRLRRAGKIRKIREGKYRALATGPGTDAMHVAAAIPATAAVEARRLG